MSVTVRTISPDKRCGKVIQSDGFFYLHLILMIDTFSCIPFYSQPLIVNEELFKMHNFSVSEGSI